MSPQFDFLNKGFGEEPILINIPHNGLTAFVGVFGGIMSMSFLGMGGPLIVGAWAINNILYNEQQRAAKPRHAPQVEPPTVDVEPAPVAVVEPDPVTVELPAQPRKSRVREWLEAANLVDNPPPMEAVPPTTRLWSENPNLPTPQPPTEDRARRDAVGALVAQLERTVAAQPSEIVTYSPPITGDWDVVQDLTDNLRSTLVIGVPGAGKGMLMSHWIRRIKAQYPELQIWGIDPKDDPKETGYWTAGFDKVFRANNERMTSTDFIGWLQGCLDKFRMAPDGKVLLWDEFTISCRRWSKQDKAGFDEITDYLVSLSSSGDSRQNYIIGVGQVPNAGDMGMSAGIRGVFKPVGILSNDDRSAVQRFIATSFAPTPAGGIDELYSIMDKSPCGRAIYAWNAGQWKPMPTLGNLSGYDRDSRQWVGPSPDAAPLACNPDLYSRAVEWVAGLEDESIVNTLLAATSGWVAWGSRNKHLPNRKAETILPILQQLEADGHIRPIGDMGRTWLKVANHG